MQCIELVPCAAPNFVLTYKPPQWEEKKLSGEHKKYEEKTKLACQIECLEEAGAGEITMKQSFMMPVSSN